MKKWPRFFLFLVIFVVCEPGQIAAEHRFQLKPEKQIRPLKVIHAPRVNVPDDATGERGWVRLKIEYRSDGTIGRIECINPDDRNRRKMEEKGLIEASILAAKKIEFRPRMVDGKPVTVFATRDYLFNW